MRVLSRLALVVVLLAVPASPLLANHQQADCPLTLVAQSAPATDFELSPAGVFRNGNLVHVLRGQVVTTYTVNDIGDLQVAREDFVGSMGGRETNAGLAFSNGQLFISSEAGLEIYDLRNVRAGGNAPILVSRTPNLHYRQLAVRGNTLAGLYPLGDLGCVPGRVPGCQTTIDLFDVSSLAAPVRIGTIAVPDSSLFVGFHDIAFSNGYLIATSQNGIASFNVNAAGAPRLLDFEASGARWLVSNGTNVFAAGNDIQIDLFSVASDGSLVRIGILTAPQYMTIERANGIMFSPQAFLDEQNGRLITMINERDPQTGQPARTIAFDVFDLTAPVWEGSAERIYENVSELEDDEVKHSPVAVGPYVYVIGETSGLQSWGACNVATGRIELESLFHLPCGASSLHGWVTGTQKIANVEVFLDNGALGAATLSGPTRNDVSSRTPVQTWRINVNFDTISRGDHTIRAVATDVFGNRRQFASQRLFFPGPGLNCTNRRRAIR